MLDKQDQTTTTIPGQAGPAQPGQAGNAAQAVQVVKMQLTGKGMAVILGSVAIIVAAVVLAIFLLRDNTDIALPYAPAYGAGVMTEENVRQLQEEQREKVARGMFETHMNMTWTFPDGRSASSDAVMGNSPNNNFAFWFTVTLSTGEEVFRSNLIPVGTEIAEIKLNTELAAGKYAAVVRINMIEDDGTPVEGSSTGINITLNVQG